MSSITGGVDTPRLRRDNARMAAPGPPPLVKLICGILSNDSRRFTEATRLLVDAFGPVEDTSETWNFDFTDYYEQSMGGGLLRQFVSFRELVPADKLASIKRHTNDLEARFATAEPDGPDRPINLDPGYVAEPKLVLASMKDGPQRVYLSQGVFAEVTLLYRGGRWQALEWTFPDYASGRYDAFFSRARDALRAQLKERRG
ncbi:MAG: DUF4416 family protein [Phycisphaerae bacterium]